MGTGELPFGLSRNQARIACALLGLTLACGLTTSLWDQDEAAYAGFARTMLQSGDWIVPHFTWSEVHRKPPLLFWLSAVTGSVVGPGELAIRLPATLCVLLTLGLLASWARPRVGATTAWGAALVLASSPFVPALGKVALTDAPLLACETAAALALWNALESPSRGWTQTFWASVALGALAKGPPALLMSGALVAWLLVLHPKRRNLLRLRPWLYGPLALLPLLAWGYLAWRRTDGALIRWMLDWYVLRRARRPVFGQSGPPGYYLASFLLGLWPWSALLPWALARLWRHRREGEAIFLAGWLFAGWVIYEPMASKLPTYALGAYPALALCIAWGLGELGEGRAPIGVRAGAALAAAPGVALASVAVTGGALLLDARGRLGAALLTLSIAASIWALLGLARSGAKASTRLALAGAALGLAAWAAMVPALESARGASRRLAAEAERLAPGMAVALPENLHRPSLAYYLGLRGELHEGPPAPGEASVLSDSSYLALPEPRPPAEPVAAWDLDHLRPTTYWLVLPRR